MKKSVFVLISFGLIAASYLGCNGSVVPVGQNGDASSADGSTLEDAGGGNTDSGGGATLQWYRTCGDPVCPAPTDAGATDAGGACALFGSACTTKGETCGDPNQNCGVILVCDDHDPRVPSCPISSQKYKQDITYLDDAALGRLHDETLSMKLATYRYKGRFIDPNDPNATHLGFIVEDQPRSLSVDRGHDRVDLYGYLSMSVATMQVQEREITELKKQVTELQKTCAKRR